MTTWILPDFSDIFARYDQSIEQGDRKKAHRSKIMAKDRAVESLAMAGGGAPGLYIAMTKGDSAQAIKYIGITDTSFSGRFLKRFRDENALDRGLDEVPPRERLQLIRRRIEGSMKPSAAREKYPLQHFATHALFSGVTAVKLFPSNISRKGLEAVEGYLVFAASAFGQNCINISKTKKIDLDIYDGEPLLNAVCSQFDDADASFADLLREMRASAH